jgi:hypothetical protein
VIIEETSQTGQVDLFLPVNQSGVIVRFIEVVPQTVVIEGVKSEIAKVKSVKTEPLDITGIGETSTQDLKIDLRGKNMRAEVNDVSVKVVIGTRGR